MENRMDNMLWPGWDMVRLIGRGSFGAVYEIERQVGGQKEKAALKVITIPQNKEAEILALRADGYDDESITSYFKESCAQFEKEYAMMAGMKGNSHIVYCDDLRIIQHDDGFGWNIYIKMELLTPLKNYLPQSIPQEQVIRLGVDMCQALEECQRRHIVHRDIKPGNIFVSRDGTYKLGDFGIARTMEQTMGGTKVGTYEYMAPEVYNNQPYGTGADIYSVGLVLYWMLNDRTGPFTTPGAPPSQREKARVRRYSGEPLPAPTHGSEALKQIVLKACAFDPKDRYIDPAQMREELEALLYGQEKSPAQKIEEKERRIKYYVQGEDGLIREEYGTTKNPLPLEGRKVIMMTMEDDEGEETTPQPTPRPAASEEPPVQEDITTGADYIPPVPAPADDERTAGVNYAPVQEEAMPQPAEPVIPEPDPDGEITQGVRDVQPKPQPEEAKKGKEEQKSEKAKPKLKKKTIAIMAVAAVLLAVLIAVIVIPVRTGSIVRFGHYEQDNDTTNGEESIEWIVLDVQDGKALIISKYGLDVKAYNSLEDTTWETSSLRHWLNNAFVSGAFTSEEQSKILTTTVSTSNNSLFGTRGGSSTRDKVFLLSIEEAKEYFASNAERACAPTDYARFKGTYIYKDKCAWWLRSPGASQDMAAAVSVEGSIDYNGYFVSSNVSTVRPAMWVDIDALR